MGVQMHSEGAKTGVIAAGTLLAQVQYPDSTETQFTVMLDSPMTATVLMELIGNDGLTVLNSQQMTVLANTTLAPPVLMFSFNGGQTLRIVTAADLTVASGNIQATIFAA
jgi:hypothetical protein